MYFADGILGPCTQWPPTCDATKGQTTTLKSVVERTDAWDLSSSDVAPLHRLSSLWPADSLS